MRMGKHEDSRFNTEAGVCPALLQNGVEESPYMHRKMGKEIAAVTSTAWVQAYYILHLPERPPHRHYQFLE
jgi:hypothetical protein